MDSTYSPKNIEDRWYQAWTESGCFEPKGEGEPYSIVIPPPNVTGALHLGHALNNTLQDILIRWQRKLGKKTLWIPGTDHAGIATQAVVERRLFEGEKKTRHDLGRAALVEKIWQWKDEYENTIVTQLKHMGLSLDWSRQRFTLDEVCARAVYETFFHLFQKKLIYRGKRLVNWDTHLQTAVADDEIFYETVMGHMWTFKYMLSDGSGFLPVSTTRPETILGDTAVAVHPEDERYKKYIGKKVIVPFVGREIEIIADGLLVDPEFGTGCVKVTPAHDPNDYATGLRHNLEMINILTDDGRIGPAGGPFEGLSRKKSREAVVEALEKEGLLIKTEDHEMQVGHSDRSKTPIEPYLSDQWFVAMENLAERAMDSVRRSEIRFFPERYAKSYLDWLGEKRDWCISRQLWWGHQIPIWYCETCSEGELQGAFENSGEVTWQPAEGGWLICSRTGELDVGLLPGHSLRRDPDVLDTWFSSALWPHSTLGWPASTQDLKTFYPTSVLVTSRDIISLWVARMVMTGQENMGGIPFHHVYIHSTILDGKGQRMSKSKGNGVDPRDIIEKYGADALRYTLASMGTDNQDARLPVQQETLPDGRTINVSEKFELGRNFANKLWNAVRFVLPHYQALEKAGVLSGFETAELDQADKWILTRLQDLISTVNDNLAKYRFADVCSAIYHFTWDNFCSTYLEIRKNTIHSPVDSPERRRAVQVFMYVVEKVLNLLNPITPFVTEEIWRSLGKSDMLITTPWPQVQPQYIHEEAAGKFSRILIIVEGIRSIRGSYSIPLNKKLQVLLQVDSAAPLTEEDLDIVGNFENLDSLDSQGHSEAPKFSASFLFPGGRGFVALEGILDKEKETKKMQAELEHAQKFVVGIEKKLSNEKFVANAPADVIQKERDKLASQIEKIRKLESSLTAMHS